MKGNNAEDVRIKKDDRIQLRINKEHKEIINRIAKEKNYKCLSDYILSLILRDISTSEFINKQMIKDK